MPPMLSAESLVLLAYISRYEMIEAWIIALREHETHRSDPTRNLATGLALYAAESRLRAEALTLEGD